MTARKKLLRFKVALLGFRIVMMMGDETMQQQGQHSYRRKENCYFLFNVHHGHKYSKSTKE